MKTRLGDCQFQVNKKRGRVLLRPLSLHGGDLWPRPSWGAWGERSGAWRSHSRRACSGNDARLGSFRLGGRCGNQARPRGL